MGVGIGYAHRDNLVGLVQLFSVKGRAEELTNALREIVQQTLSELPNATSLLDLGMHHEEKRCREQVILQKTSHMRMWEFDRWVLKQLMLHKNGYLSEEKWDRWADKHDITLDSAFKNIQTVISIGIGLGGAFPQKAEQFWTHQYHELTTEEEEDVRLGRAYGLNLPAKMPDPISLAEYGEQMRVFVDAFIAENRPDVVTPEQRQDNSGRITPQPSVLTYADLKARHAAAKAPSK